MKYFNALIKPASSRCNLRCKYCFYHDISHHRDVFSYGIMNQKVMEKLIQMVFDYFQEEVMITFAFQGGEPTCAGIDYFHKFIEYVNLHRKEYHHVAYSIQTNATLLDEKWLDLFEKHHFLVGVSLDGYLENHNLNRIDINQQGTFKTFMKNIVEMKKRNIEFNILTVLTSQLSKHSQKLFNFYNEHQLNNIQLIPCLNELDTKNSTYSLKPREFFKFYDQLFPLWFQEFQKGNYISYNYFDNLVLLFKGRYPYQCGYLGYCNMQFVIESDGSVYPCDFYCLDQYKIGNIQNDSINDLIRSNVLHTFLKEPKRMSKKCETCRFLRICNGQCKRSNMSYFEDDYCALYEFMNKYEKELYSIARRV